MQEYESELTKLQSQKKVRAINQDMCTQFGTARNNAQ